MFNADNKWLMSDMWYIKIYEYSMNLLRIITQYLIVLLQVCRKKFWCIMDWNDLKCILLLLVFKKLNKIDAYCIALFRYSHHKKWKE